MVVSGPPLVAAAAPATRSSPRTTVDLQPQPLARAEQAKRRERKTGVLLEQIGDAKAGFRRLTEAIDTTTPAGRMMTQMVGAFAEFERAILRERTRVGLEAARQEGRIGGRPPKLSPQQQTEIRKMVSGGKKTGADAARLFKVHPATVSRLLRRPYAK